MVKMMIFIVSEFCQITKTCMFERGGVLYCLLLTGFTGLLRILKSLLTASRLAFLFLSIHPDLK